MRTEQRRGTRILLFGLCAVGVTALVVSSRVLPDQWIEVPRDGMGNARVIELLEASAIAFTTEPHFGVMYLRVPQADWPQVSVMLDRDSINSKYPLNIKRKNMFGQVRDIVRHPPYLNQTR